MQEKYCARDISDVLHKELNFVNRGVATFDPDNNSLTTTNGTKYTYDFLVVSSGLQLRWEMIEGAMDALKDPDCPAGSMYILPFAHKMSRLRENFKGGKAHFTVGKLPIKCGGAPQKIMHLSEETWRKNGVRDKCDIHFHSSIPKMFPVPLYSDALHEIAVKKNIDCHFNSIIHSVDGPNRTVTFRDREDNLTTHDFDLLHIVPP
mmetsp:Transcript_4464/g.6626  ORF Transcript_4464/g.6626 Transcript_4464/m.6626 type:complete len:205 (+) Transcript_4464:347-961(+)